MPPRTAGCRHCIPVLQALLVIADALADAAGQQVRSVRAHSGIECAVERGERPDIVVAMSLEPSANDMATGCETPVRALRARLEQLGVCQRGLAFPGPLRNCGWLAGAPLDTEACWVAPAMSPTT